MKLYPKKLNSLEELKRECIRLNYEKKQSGLADLLPGGGNKAHQSESSSASGIVSTAMSLISGGSAIDTVFSLIGPVTGMLKKSKKPKKILGTIAKDLLFSYVLGKGIQLTAKGLRKYLRKRKEKKLLAEIEALSARKR